MKWRCSEELGIQTYLNIWKSRVNKKIDIPSLKQQLHSEQSGTSRTLCKQEMSTRAIQLHKSTYIYIMESNWNPDSNALDSDLPQHDCPATSVMPSNILSPSSYQWDLICRRKNLAHLSKVLLIFFFTFFYVYTWNCVKSVNVCSVGPRHVCKNFQNRLWGTVQEFRRRHETVHLTTWQTDDIYL